MVKAIGVYKIKNTVNGKFYIGSSKHIQRRWDEHKRKLKKGDHDSPYLQASYNKYGKESFILELIEECDLDIRIDREQHYIDTLKPQYNINRTAGQPPKLTKEQLTKTAKANWASGVWDHRLRPIDRIDPNTGEIKEYKSQAEAERDGFEQASVGKVLQGKISSFANYYWQYADGSTPLVKVKYEKVFRKVIGTSLDGTKTVELSSFDECHSQGFNYGKVRACCAGISGRRTHNGFIWQYADKYVQGKAEQNKGKTFAEVFCKGVVRIDPKTNERKEYESQAATEKDGFRKRDVSSCCRGKRKTHGGFLWIFREA